MLLVHTRCSLQFFTWQAFALVGCLVTGTLARRRRIEVEGLNNRLRQINSELLQRSSVEVCHLIPRRASLSG